MAITYEDIQKANESIETTNIKGKEYAQVHQRVKAFRMVYPEGRIETNMISNENGICVFKAEIWDQLTLLATGHAYEKEGSSYINKTSFIENCETSAIGRALGLAGFGIDTSVASAEEVENAINNQDKKISEQKVKTLTGMIESYGLNTEDICAYYDHKNIAELTESEFAHCLKKLDATRKEKEEKHE